MIGSWHDVGTVVHQIAQRPEGFKWLLVEQGDCPEAMKPSIIAACHQEGLMCGVWDPAVDFGTPAHVADGFDCYVGQIEGPGQEARLEASLPAFRAAHPTLPAAVVTNTAGISTPELAKPFIDAGFSCITETWVKTDGVPPENRVAYMKRMGFADPQPMAGLGENGATMADYPTIKDFAGYSVFGAEALLAS